MPFLRSSALGAVSFAVACAMTLVAVAPSSARAESAPVPNVGDDALPSRAQATRAQVPTPVADAARFCPRPTGRWWDDLAVRGCVELLSGRDHTAPVTPTELSWLDLGSLPAYAIVDVDAVGATLAAYEQRLADEAAEEAAAAEAAEEAAAAEAAREAEEAAARAASSGTARGTTGSGRSGPATAVVPGTTEPRGSRPSEEDIRADRENAAYDACLEQLGSVDILDQAASAAFFEAHARCVDAQVPGYYERWAAQNAEFNAWLAELKRKEDEALARLAVRRERALQEIRDTCPHGGFASPTQYFVSSYDDIEYIVTCYDGPNG